MDWHSYINESPYQAFVNSKDYLVYLRLVDSLQQVWSFSFGDLRYKNVAKKIIQERTQAVAVAKGHPPFCFRFQCLTTGRKSKFIKECDYHLFGITKMDSLTGTGYGDATIITDKLEPIRADLSGKLRDMHERAFQGSGGQWWSRYSEYLKSDEWLAIRERVIERDGGQCKVSGDTTRLQVHHLSYRNVGREQDSELVTLCKRVHEAIHDANNPKHSELVTRLNAYFPSRNGGFGMLDEDEIILDEQLVRDCLRMAAKSYAIAFLRKLKTGHFSSVDTSCLLQQDDAITLADIEQRTYDRFLTMEGLEPDHA